MGLLYQQITNVAQAFRPAGAVDKQA